MTQNRPTAQETEALLEQHRQIERLIEELENDITNRTVDCCKIAERVKFLCGLLAQHFRFEEEGGFFSEVVLVAPRLVERAKALEGQHQALLDLLHSFCDKTCADGIDKEQWWSHATEAFLRFKKEISRHEHDENMLVQEAFLADLGSKD